MRLLIPLFSPATGTWGGLTRVIAIADAAKAAGHSVAFCASGYLERTLCERGYRVYSVPPTTVLGLPQPLSERLARRSQNASLPVKPGKSVGNIWFVQVISGTARANYLRQVVASEVAAVRDFQPDRLFTDLDLGAYCVAQICGIPIASAYQNVMSEGAGSFFWKLVTHATNKVLKAYAKPELPAHELVFGPHVLKIIPSIPELDGADPNRADVCYVGHLLGAIKSQTNDIFQPIAGQRYMFVYVGTGSVTQKTIREVLPPLLAQYRDRQAIVAGSDISTPARIGALEFRPYVSAEALLPYCDWTLCHGGQNTIIQSLIHGVPLMVFPGAIFERRFNGRKVQEAGAGRMGELPDFRSDWLQATFEQQAPFAAQARPLGKRIESFGGAQRAVQAIVEWANGAGPARPNVPAPALALADNDGSSS